MVIPMLIGPYFAWVNQECGIVVALILAFFTTYVVVALLYLHRNLEDPFVADRFIEGQHLTSAFEHTLNGLKEIKEAAEYRSSFTRQTDEAEKT